MKLACVIGRVTLSCQDPGFNGGRFLVTVPWKPGRAIPTDGSPLPRGNSIVVYDNLGATTGDVIGYADGGEAAAPFTAPVPCDAFNCAIIDETFHNPPKH